MDLRQLGQRIRAQREKCRLKQTDLASALQVSPQAVSKWERGENAPDIALLAPLARLLGVSVDHLLGAHAESRDVFEATVLVCGAAGAREKSETLAPRQFAAWTNSVCLQVTEAVLQNDGVPIKFPGPGILAFFSGTKHRNRAVHAAVSAKAGSAVRLKIGLGTGEVYFGAIGHPDYAQADIMGEAVSIALLGHQWAADHTDGGLVACTATVADLGDEFALGEEHEVTFPGISHAVRLREIRS